MELKEILKLIDDSPSFLYVKKTLRMVGHAFKLYDLKNLVVSFNGGKDAEVVLQLVRLALYKEYCKKESDLENEEIFQKHWKQLKVVYFEEADPIPEVDVFVKEQAKQYGFDPITLGKDMKKETFTLVEKYDMKAVFVGTRRVDPYACHIECYSPSDTDKGWAAFMRIHPIIDWNYEQVWKFLKDFKLPYCSLYDQGYTHLGNLNNSAPNVFLRKDSGEYLPASQADAKYEHFSRTCAGRSKEYLGTKHFVIVYKNSMTDILEAIKSIEVLFGDAPHISVIEIKYLKEFLDMLVKNTESINSENITIVYNKFKVELQDLKEETGNIDDFKVFETSAQS